MLSCFLEFRKCICFLLRIRDEAKELISDCTTRANRTQNDVTEKLGERIQDVNYWKFELERGIQDITSEIILLFWSLTISCALFLLEDYMLSVHRGDELSPSIKLIQLVERAVVRSVRHHFPQNIQTSVTFMEPIVLTCTLKVFLDNRADMALISHENLCIYDCYPS